MPRSLPSLRPLARLAGSRRGAFLGGALAAAVGMAIARLLINATTVVDLAVAPLMVADTGGTGDAIVVLGAGRSGPECLPNGSGTQRVLLAARLLGQGRGPMVVFTGGPAGAPCTIAAAMEHLALDLGVPASRIALEAGALSTRENAERAAPLLRGLGVRRVLLVTDRLHLRRASGAFEALGFEVERAGVEAYLHTTDNVDLAVAGAREFLAYAYYRARGWTAAASPAGPAPSDVQMLNSSPLPRTWPTGPIAVLGASYAQGWQPDSLAGVPVVNLGVAGQQSFELLDRFERDVLPVQPRAVILWGFINDVFRAPAGGLQTSLERVRNSYVEMVALARRHGVEPILTTEITVRPPDSLSERVAGIVNRLRGREGYQEAVNRSVLETNRWLVELARKEGLFLLDFQAALGEPGGARRREFIAADNSHVSAAGYEALTQYARPLMEMHVRSR